METFWLLPRWGVHLIWCRMHNLQEHCICSAPLCMAGGCQTTHVVRLMIDKDFRGTYTNLVGRAFRMGGMGGVFFFCGEKVGVFLVCFKRYRNLLFHGSIRNMIVAARFQEIWWDENWKAPANLYPAKQVVWFRNFHSLRWQTSLTPYFVTSSLTF